MLQKPARIAVRVRAGSSLSAVPLAFHLNGDNLHDTGQSTDTTPPSAPADQETPTQKLGRLFLAGSGSSFWFLLAAGGKFPWITYYCFLAPSSKDGFVPWQTDGAVERMTTIPAMTDVRITLKQFQYL